MFYDNLKSLCQKRGTTVTTMLKELKFSSGSTGNWSRGVLPTMDKAIAMANYLDVTIDELIYGERTKMSTDIDPEWIEIISNIPADKQKMCKDFLRTHMVIPEKYADSKHA